MLVQCQHKLFIHFMEISATSFFSNKVGTNIPSQQQTNAHTVSKHEGFLQGPQISCCLLVKIPRSSNFNILRASTYTRIRGKHQPLKTRIIRLTFFSMQYFTKTDDSYCGLSTKSNLNHQNNVMLEDRKPFTMLLKIQ